MPMPNFLIIGAGKSGTTSLYEYLKAHPQIFMSALKEPKLFAYEGENPGGDFFLDKLTISSLESYQRLFENSRNSKAVGEASTVYIYSAQAASRIRHHIPRAKLIAILRDPAERAFAHYLYFVQTGHETLPTFPQALRAESERMLRNVYSGWFYRDRGYYYTQLKRYFDVFPREQLQIHLYQDFCADRAGVLRDVLRFLEVDETLLPDISEEYNVTAVPRSRFMNAALNRQTRLKPIVRACLPSKSRKRLLNWLNRMNSKRPRLAPEIRAELIEGYREDILKLQDLIGRDLSAWLRLEGEDSKPAQASAGKESERP
jgi:hypothetical protein